MGDCVRLRAPLLTCICRFFICALLCLGMEHSSLSDDSGDDERQYNFRFELKRWGLDDEFGGLLTDFEGETRAFTGQNLVTASDDPSYIFKNVICHRRRRDGKEDCTCLTGFINPNGGAITIDELILVIVQSRNFVRSEGTDSRNCMRNLFRSKFFCGFYT